MRILFVQKRLGQEMMGLMSLSRRLKDAGHETRCLLLPSPGNLLDRVRDFAPDLLCYGTTTGLHRYYQDVNRHIRRHYDAMTVFGGIYPTFVPQILEDPCIDAICIGEGDEAMVEFANRLEAGESVLDVENFHVKHEGKIHINAVRPQVQDLDSLGFPDRELLYEDPDYGNNPYKVFMTSRGCVARCHYCFHSGWGKTYDDTPGKYLRRRSVEHVIAEIEQVRRRWPLEFVHFTDDMFNFDKKWQESFLREYRRRIGLPFSVIFMIDWINPDLLQLYREAGCVNIRIAFETASDDLKADLNRFKSSPSVNQMKAATMIRESGIRLTTLNMVGIPGGTITNEINTLRMNLEAQPDQVLVNFIHPYPGTAMDQVIEKAGIERKPYDEYEISATRSSPLSIPDKASTENLHHLFPLVIRFPKVLGLLPTLLRARGRALSKLYLVVFGLCMDLQYVELLHSHKTTWRRRLAIARGLVGRLGLRARSIAGERLFRRRNPLGA